MHVLCKKVYVLIVKCKKYINTFDASIKHKKKFCDKIYEKFWHKINKKISEKAGKQKSIIQLTFCL